MNLELSHTIDSIKDGTKEVAETAHAKTNEFHEKYVSTVIPDMGKYGDAAKFVAEMAPGVSEYNAIREGDWQAFAIAAGIDVASIAIGAVTLGAGYGAVKGGTVAAKAGVKAAAKEVAEAGAKKAAKELAEAGAEKVAKEVAEAGAEKVVKEVAEAGAKKAVKEVAEAGAEKVVKEAADAGAEKVAKEVVEAGTEKAVKEVAEASAEKTVKEVADDVVKKAAKEVDEVSQIVKNKWDGIAREEKVWEELIRKYGKENIFREQYIRNGSGVIIKDTVTNEARRIDFVVKKGDRIIRAIEVTAENVDKTAQLAKEARILELAKEMGGAFIRDFNTGKLYEITKLSEVVRI